MKEEQIRNYARLMEELGLSALEISEGKEQLRLERQMTAAAMPVMLPKIEERKAEETTTAGAVCSPMVGIFYAAPAENADSYVHVGDRVQKGQTLCIIEAMKLLSEISAEYDGYVKEICVENGQSVEYGTPLFVIERA